ncbi:hypothetical protein Hanom_Chr06g00533651 [Helianthus anomalus]
MYPRFIQMMIDDQVNDLPKDPADELGLHHMKSDTLSRLTQYKLKKDETEPRAKRMIFKIDNRNYVAPENDAWRHENNNSEDDSGRLSGMHEKKFRYWFVKDGKRKRTPNASPTVTPPKVSTPKIVFKGPSKKSPPRLVDEMVILPVEVIQGGVDLLKDSLESFLKKNKEAEAAKAAKIQDSNVKKIYESSKNVQEESVKDKEPEGVGKVTLKKKPQKKKKGSDEEDETYIPTPQAEKKKVIKKRKVVQTGVISRSVRARKGSASIPKLQSGKGPVVEAQEVQTESIPDAKVQSVEKPIPEKEKAPESLEYVRIEKKDDAETSKSKKTSIPGLFEGFPNVQGEFTDDILPDEEYDMFHDATVKELTKKVSLLEKEKAKVEAERDKLKKQLKKIIKVNEEMKSVVKNHAKRINTLVEDVDDNVKLFEQLFAELSEINVKYANMIETNQTLHQMLDELHEASSNEIKVLKLEIEALRADKAVKDEQLNMLYTIMEHHLGINVQAIYNDLEIQRVEERRAQREKELAEASTQKKKDLNIETQEAGGSSSQPEGDVEMVDVVNVVEEHMEVDQDQGFVLVGDSAPLSYSFYDIIRLVKVEQCKWKARELEVMLLRYKEEEKKEVEEEEKLDDKELDELFKVIDNYHEGNDDDDDQGSTGMLVGMPSVQQSLDDFLNDEINEQQEDHHQESSSSGKQHSDQFDIEDEIPSSPEKEYEFKYANEADNFDHVEVEECSDISEEDTPFHYSGIDDTFPTLAEMLKEQNEDEIRRKVVEKISTEGIPKVVPQETLLEDILSWGYLEDLEVYAIRREQGVQYFEFLSDIQTPPWWDVEELVQTKNIKQFYYGLDLKVHDQRLWKYIKWQTKNQFSDWKP